MPLSKLTKKKGFDITVVQVGDEYIVSGADAAALYEKIVSVPAEAQNLIVGPLEQGKFSLRKPAAQESKTANG